VLQTGELLLDVVIEYITAHPGISAALEGRFLKVP
jgi:hypothetical protein